MRGILVHVYRSDLGDCTNRGVTSPEKSKGKHVVLFSDKGGNIDLDDCQEGKHVCLFLVEDEVMGRPRVFARPMKGIEGVIGPMFGGNFIYASDSRFPTRYPIPVHDRFETQEEYDSNFE